MNLYERHKEHCKDYEKKSENSFMRKHVDSEHEGKGENVEFNWRVTGTFKKPLQRQLTEAVKISRKTNAENLNSKNEYNGQRLRRLNFNEQTDQFRCDTCGAIFETKSKLLEHHEKFHKVYNCAKCEYTSIGNVDLKYHKMYIHDE